MSSGNLRMPCTRKFHVDANWYAVCRVLTTQSGDIARRARPVAFKNGKLLALNIQLYFVPQRPNHSATHWQTYFCPAACLHFASTIPATTLAHHSSLPGKLALAQTPGRANLPCKHFSLLIQHEIEAQLTHFGAQQLSPALGSDWCAHHQCMPSSDTHRQHALAFYISIPRKFISFYLSLLAVASNWPNSNC